MDDQNTTFRRPTFSALDIISKAWMVEICDTPPVLAPPAPPPPPRTPNHPPPPRLPPPMHIN